MKKILLLFICLFALGSLVACGGGKDGTNDNNQNVQTNVGNEEQTPTPVPTPVVPDGGETVVPTPGIPETTVDVGKVTFENATVEYTGEPISFTVKNLPGGVSVEYTYLFEGNEVTEMVEMGDYEVTAVIKDKETGAELRTLSAILTIEPKKIVDEIPDDAESNIELTYTTHYIQMRQNPDDTTQLIAAGLELYASETIYFVLDRDPSWTTENFPLNFLELDEDSVECASIVENALVISEPGTYDVIMMFPEGSLVPLILVREGADNSLFYFRGTMNDYEASEEYLFAIDESTNTASYEIELAVGDVFKIANYYYSVSFDFDPHFLYMPQFAAGGEYGNDVAVNAAGTYKFVVDLASKTLSITKDGEAVVADKDLLFLRGTMNSYGLTHPLIKSNGVASIEIELAVDDVFAIGDTNWTKQYGYASFFSSMSTYFVAGGEYGDDIKVLQAGTYRIEVALEENTVTVYKDGVQIGTQTGTVGGGNQGEQTEFSYQLVINGTQKIDLIYKGKAWVENEEHEEFVAYNVQLNAGDVITLYDVKNNASWAITTPNPWSSGNPVGSADGITMGETGSYDIYVQFLFEKDKIYFGPAQ